MGLAVIGFGVASSFGVAFYVGLFFAPHLHPIIPFLLLGIGVDNMFVIVQALENLNGRQTRLPVPERIGLAMKHAGVSITVTSITNMSVFLIGSTSVSTDSKTLYGVTPGHLLVDLGWVNLDLRCSAIR